ncbi:MAG: hypothetical protein IIA73_01540 [Proteobacteria bacterium]|nr:hypothetical protein [Pseudomonadota bacterium]
MSQHQCLLRAVCAVSALTLGACASFELAERATNYNLSFEQTSNRLMLLNAVRASKRYPLYFTRFNLIRATSPVSGTARLDLPFGGDAQSNFNFAPSITLSDGTTFDLQVLDDQDFYKGILSPITAKTFDFYLKRGWPKDMLFHLFIQKIEVTEVARMNVIKESDTLCLKSENEKKCKRISQHQIAGLTCERKPTTRYLNYPSNPCSLLRFQQFMTRLRVLDFDTKTISSRGEIGPSLAVKDVGNLEDLVEVGKSDLQLTLIKIPGQPDKYELRKPSVKFGFTLRKLEKLNVSGSEEGGADSKGKTPAGEITIFLNSPQGMIFYLGEVMRSQLMPDFGGPSYIPQITLGPDRENHRLFTVVTGEPAGSAVSVEHEGTTYSIPSVRDRGVSMQVLALVSQVFAILKKSQAIPTTQAVTLIGQ